MNTRKRGNAMRLVLLTIIVAPLAMASQSCDKTNTTLCATSGIRCPTGWICAAAQDVCIQDGCGDGFVDTAAGEVCDDGNVIDDESCSSNCRQSINCGNGRVDGKEVCDDDNNISGDGCSADCRSTEICGNNYRDVDELCDDGNTVGGDGCSSDCKLIETCGDGDRDPGEICDDDNNVSGDGCSKDCLSNESCGNAYKDVEEYCDDGPLGSAECDSDCSEPRCGDRWLNTMFENPDTGDFEECDGGGNTDECDADCTQPECGDGFPNDEHLFDPGGDEEPYGEECDDGNDENTDACLNGCKRATCGDDFLWEGEEQCDDGEDDNSDTVGLACRTDCTLPTCGDDVIDDGFKHGMRFREECDQGAENSNIVPLACRADCKLPFCGDNVTDAGSAHGMTFNEECDDANASNNDACVAGCRMARCNDGYLHHGFEQCEADADCAALGLVRCLDSCQCA